MVVLLVLHPTVVAEGVDGDRPGASSSQHCGVFELFRNCLTSHIADQKRSLTWAGCSARTSPQTEASRLEVALVILGRQLHAQGAERFLKTWSVLDPNLKLLVMGTLVVFQDENNALIS